MATVFPKIMDRVMESVISSEDMMPYVSDKAEMDPVLDTANVEIDLENTDDEDDSEDILAYQTENDYVAEKEEAIYALFVPAKDSIMYLDKLQFKRKSVLTKYRVLFQCLTLNFDI